MPEEITTKIKNNAIITYLLIWFSWFFLFNKDKNINNPFVRSHIKSSIVLHIFIILIYIVFIHFDFLWRITIFSKWLNIFIANILFIFTWILIVRGIYSAWQWKEQKIWNSIKISSWISLDLNNDNIFDEKDKLTIILSYIPFIWYITGSKFDNKFIQNILKLNLLISLILSIIYIYNYENIFLLFGLIYIIFIAFSGVYLYGTNWIVLINLPDYFSPKWLLEALKNFWKYLFYYFWWNFKEFSIVVAETEEKNLQVTTKELEELKSVPSLNKKWLKYLIYVPIVNLAFLFIKESNYKYHIKNWLALSFVFIIFFILKFFGYFYLETSMLFLFPIAFWFWMLPLKYYKMPFIYDLYRWLARIKQIFMKTKKIIKEKSSENHEENIKV
jgi:hypothetical protein